MENSVDNLIQITIKSLRAPKASHTKYEDIVRELPEPVDGPYSISEAERGEMEKREPVPQPAYRYPWIDPMEHELAPQMVEFDGREMGIDEYLGDQWHERHILTLNAQGPIETPPKFAATPHSWQLSGAAKLDFLCKSNFKGGICGDSMGLGKTLIAIMAMELSRSEHGCFSLVICPASCRNQWREEILGAYQPGCAPKILILEDPHATPQEIIKDGYEILIASYQFVTERFREAKSVNRRFRDYRDLKTTAVPTLPACVLHSELWKNLDLPIKRLILDESQKIKREEGTTFQAIKHLHRRATILLSGTILHNTWKDCINAVLLLQGHPFLSRGRFLSAFVEGYKPRNTQTELDKTSTVRIQRFLLAVMFARPSETLELPDIDYEQAEFSLDEEIAAKVTECIKKYWKAIGHRAKEINANRTPINNHAIKHAVEAQLWSAHRLLCTRSSNQATVSDGEGTDSESEFHETAVKLTAEVESVSCMTRQKWLQSLKDLPLEELLDSRRLRAVLQVWDKVLTQSPDGKVVIFSMYLKFLDIVAEALRRVHGIEPLMFHGSMTSTERTKVQQIFAEPDNRMPLLITMGAGSVGLNIQSGTIVIQTEIWWNRNQELQAAKRCHRPGQQRRVRVLRLRATNSDVDNEVKKTQERKTSINTDVMSSIIRKDEDPLVVPLLPEDNSMDVS